MHSPGGRHVRFHRCGRRAPATASARGPAASFDGPMTANSGAPTTGRVARRPLPARIAAVAPGSTSRSSRRSTSSSDRQVAVRLVHPDICATPGFAERFRDTMQKVASLTPPEHRDRPRLGSGGVERAAASSSSSRRTSTGGSLRDLLDRGRLLSPSQALVVGLDVCRALDAAHRTRPRARRRASGERPVRHGSPAARRRPRPRRTGRGDPVGRAVVGQPRARPLRVARAGRRPRRSRRRATCTRSR